MRRWRSAFTTMIWPLYATAVLQLWMPDAIRWLLRAWPKKSCRRPLCWRAAKSAWLSRITITICWRRWILWTNLSAKRLKPLCMMKKRVRPCLTRPRFWTAITAIRYCSSVTALRRISRVGWFLTVCRRIWRQNRPCRPIWKPDRPETTGWNWLIWPADWAGKPIMWQTLPVRTVWILRGGLRWPMNRVPIIKMLWCSWWPGMLIW